MRILFLNSIPADVFGGVEHWIGQVARGLITRGHYVTIAGRPGSAFLDRTSRAVPGAVIEPLTISGDFDPITINRLRGIIASHRIDVVVANFNKDIRLGGLAARWIGDVGLVWRAGLDLTGSGWVHRALTPRLVDAVITPSTSLKEEIAAHGYIPADLIHPIHTGLPPLENPPSRSEAAERLRQKYRLPADSLVCVTSGRFVDQKGHDVLIEALPRIVENNDSVYFLLLGDGPLQEQLQAMARNHGVERHLIFAGMLEEFDLELIGSDLMVHPARWEPFGIVLVEGMRAGLPIVAARVGGIPEVVEEGASAVLVEAGVVEPLAAAVSKLLADEPQRRRMGESGQQRWRENFSYQSMIEHVEALLTEVVARKQRASHA